MNPEKILKEIEAGELPSGMGRWIRMPSSLPIIGREKGVLLEKIVKEKNPRLILEVGTLVGYSAILMGMHLKKGKIISLEFDSHAAEIARQNIAKAGLSDKIEIIVGDARETIPKIKDTIDMLFLDAAKEEYFGYLKLAEPKLAKNAVIVADNAKIFAEEMRDFLDYVRNSGKYKSTFHDFGFDGVEVSERL